MRASSIAWVIVIILLLLGILLWATSQAPNSTPSEVQQTQTASTTTETQTPPQQTVVLASASSTKLGTYLVSADSTMTVYEYAKDTMGTTTCYGKCTDNWPPLTTAAISNLAPATPDIAGTISTIQRADGTLQVTYNGMPLYYFVNDVAPGDTKGQNVGNVWKVVKP